MRGDIFNRFAGLRVPAGKLCDVARVMQGSRIATGTAPMLGYVPDLVVMSLRAEMKCERLEGVSQGAGTSRMLLGWNRGDTLSVFLHSGDCQGQ